MTVIKLARVTRNGVDFVLIDNGDFDAMSGQLPSVAEDEIDRLPERFRNLPVLQVATSIVGMKPVYAGDTSLVPLVTGIPMATLAWESIETV